MPYVYKHIRLDTKEPFYIGIGNVDNFRRSRSKSGRNNYWKNIVNKYGYEVEIIFEHSDYELVKEKEKEFIELYGRSDLGKGLLCNNTSGGEGSLNRKVSDITKEKIRKTQIGKTISQEHRDKIRISNTGKKHSKEALLKMSLCKKGNTYWKGKKHTEETKLKMSINNARPMLGKKHSKESKAIMSISRSGENNKLNKKYINTITKEIYYSGVYAAKCIGVSYSHFKNMISGRKQNVTNLTKLNDYKGEF
jgi:hypothetical protein